MYNYHTNLIWAIDKVLFLILFSLGTLTVICAMAKKYSRERQRKALLDIKNNLYEAVLKGKKTVKLIKPVSAGQFLDVVTNRNRDLVFFNAAEQELFRDYFVTAERISELEKVVSGSRNKWRRIVAILCLGYARDKSVLKTLHNALFDKDEDISYFSMLALGEAKTMDSAKALLELLKASAPSARFKIASVLESFPDEITGELFKLLTDESPDVRFWAIKLLSKFKPAEYFKKIEELTSDESEEVRVASCECLGETDKREVKGTLSKCLEDDSWLVRASAIKALGKLLGQDCFPLIMPLINDGSLSVVDAVKEVVKNHIEAAVPYIEKCLYSEDGVAKHLALEVLETSGYVPKIFKDILSGEQNKRASSFKLLEGMVKAQARFGLETALMNIGPDSRNKLIEIIGNIDQELASGIARRFRKEAGK